MHVWGGGDLCMSQCGDDESLVRDGHVPQAVSEGTRMQTQAHQTRKPDSYYVTERQDSGMRGRGPAPAPSLPCAWSLSPACETHLHSLLKGMDLRGRSQLLPLELSTALGTVRTRGLPPSHSLRPLSESSLTRAASILPVTHFPSEPSEAQTEALPRDDPSPPLPIWLRQCLQPHLWPGIPEPYDRVNAASSQEAVAGVWLQAVDDGLVPLEHADEVGRLLFPDEEGAIVRATDDVLSVAGGGGAEDRGVRWGTVLQSQVEAVWLRAMGSREFCSGSAPNLQGLHFIQHMVVVSTLQSSSHCLTVLCLFIYF